MAKTYYSIMTEAGINYINNNILSNNNVIFAEGWYISVGTGNLIPNKSTSALIHTIFDKNSNNYTGITIGKDLTYGWYAEITLPDSLNGNIITEAGLFNADGLLIAAAKTYLDLNNGGIANGLELSVKQRIYINAVNESTNIVYVPQGDLITHEVMENFINNGYATRIFDNLQKPAIDIIKSNRIYDTGISSDPEAYQKIYDLKHSNFDISKLQVIGDVNITPDGVASGFGGNNYIVLPEFDFSKPFTLITPKIIISQFETLENILIQGSKRFQLSITANNGRVLFYLNNNYNNTNIYLALNSPTVIKIVYDGIDTYSLYYQADTEWILANNFNYGEVIELSSPLSLGRHLSQQYSFKGLLDLKTLSLSVGGQEVYNCLKTGIDTVKPDDFTVKGDVSITPDGIASGFSSANTISFPFNPNAKDFELDLNFEFLDKKNDYSGYIIHGNHSPIMIWVNNHASSCSLNFILCNYGASKQFSITKAFGFPLNTRFYTKHIFKNNLYSVKFMMEGNNEWIDCGFKSVDEDITFINKVNYGIYSSSVSVDLNAVKIFYNDILSYQTCLRIPYTQAISDEKIVDKQYWNRVIDWFNQTGNGNYLMIDEENQQSSLALPTIYGLVEHNTKDIGNIVTTVNQNTVNINSLDSSKLNVGLSNITLADKNVINSLGKPDFGSGVVKEYNTLYTAETDGWLLMLTQIHGSNSYSETADIQIHGTIDNVVAYTNMLTVESDKIAYTNQNTVANAGLYRIFAGQTYKLFTYASTGNVSVQNSVLVFYPIQN